MSNQSDTKVEKKHTLKKVIITTLTCAFIGAVAGGGVAEDRVSDSISNQKIELRELSDKLIQEDDRLIRDSSEDRGEHDYYLLRDMRRNLLAERRIDDNISDGLSGINLAVIGGAIIGGTLIGLPTGTSMFMDEEDQMKLMEWLIGDKDS